nr:MAG TPA: hypothetical protein [Herelleviridae sp.]
MRVFLFFFLIGCHSFLFSLSYLFLSRSIFFYSFSSFVNIIILSFTLIPT